MTLQLVQPSNLKDFGVIFGKLALQLRWLEVDQITIRSYYDVLGELPLTAVGAAAERFAREPGRKFPPTSAEWFTLAKEVAKDAERKTLALPPGREVEWRVECGSCDDTGWVIPIECDGGSLCGRLRKHLPHTFTKVCGCRATNRTYQRHQSQQ